MKHSVHLNIPLVPFHVKFDLSVGFIVSVIDNTVVTDIGICVNEIFIFDPSFDEDTVVKFCVFDTFYSIAK
jgi:hypothetical protein